MLLLTKQMCDRYQYSRSTLQRRTRECEQSPYRDAVIHDGARRNYYRPKRWEQFLEWRSRKYMEDVYGLHVVRDRSVI